MSTKSKIETTLSQISTTEKTILEKEKENAVLEMDIKREEKNIRVFTEEVEKARERKVELEFYLKQALDNQKNKQ